MVPTIDFSLIGVVLAIWSGIKFIWDACTKALNWITQRALSLMIGSKIWATAFFLASWGIIVALLGTVTNFLLGKLASFAVSQIPVAGVRESLLFLGTRLPLSEISSVFTFAFAGRVSVLLAQQYSGWWMGIISVYKALSRGFKI